MANIAARKGHSINIQGVDDGKNNTQRLKLKESAEEESERSLEAGWFAMRK
jgi:hypothetical protein